MNSGREDVMSTSSRLNLRFQSASKRQRHPSSQACASSLHSTASQAKRRKKKSGHDGGESDDPCLTPSCDNNNDDYFDQLVPKAEGGALVEEEVVDMYSNRDICIIRQKINVRGTCPPSDQHPRGFFCYLPNEILHGIFSLLSHSDIGSLSLTSIAMNTSVQDYVYTMAGCRHILPVVGGSEDVPTVTGGNGIFYLASSYDENVSPSKSFQSFGDIIVQFESLGKLMKQLTMVHTLRSRLKTASFFLNKLDSRHHSIVLSAGHPTAYFCFGRLLFAFISGWDVYQKIKAYNLVQNIAKLEHRVEKVLRSSPSSLPLLERDVRLIHRHVFLDHAIKIGEDEYGFWLTQILKPWPITFQARLLYLLTAPEDENGFISWTEVCGCSHLQHVTGSVDFCELANSLRVMLEKSTKDWSMDDIISIINELTTMPNGWCLENVAQLLINCGTDICKGELGCRAANGRVEELIVICFYLGNACALKDSLNGDNNMRWFLDILLSTLSLLPSTTNRATFVASVIAKWQDYLTALFEDCTPDDSESDEIQVEFLTTLGNFTKLASFLLQSVLHVS